MQVKVPEYDAGEDPKAKIFEALKDSIAGINVYENRLLVATAPHMTRSHGGILYTDKAKDEQRYQGKVGLVLAMGATAFKFSGKFSWDGPAPDVGDWVFYRAADTFECGVKVQGNSGLSCRFIFDNFVMGGLKTPDLIW